MIAYDYPLLGLFWTMLWWFLLFAWIVLLFKVITDVFRNREMGGFAKAFWLIFVIVIPWLGVLIYIIAHGNGMADRDAANYAAREQAQQAYIRDVAGPISSADEIAKLADLRDRGVITDAEFNSQKATLLG